MNCVRKWKEERVRYKMNEIKEKEGRGKVIKNVKTERKRRKTVRKNKTRQSVYV
jgi:hypothetical protein